MILFNYKFQFKDSQGNFYQLRAEQLTACKVVYRAVGSVDSFTETVDYNVDEVENCLWVRLPALGPTEIGINVQMKPLRVVCTPLVTLDLVPYTVAFVCTATPVPVDSLCGHSPRVIDGYWMQYNDNLGAFENTYVRAQETVIEPGTVVDYAEENNSNAITSNAVWNIYNDQQVINNNVQNNLTELGDRIEAIEANPVKIKLNGTIFEQDANGLIDLGVIEATGSGSYMLLRDYVINGVLYKKGTQVSAADDTTILSTDPEYHYKFQCSVEDTTAEPNYALVSFSSGCYIKVQWQVYTTTKFGVIYCARNGTSQWTFTCTSQDVASTFYIYQRNHESPILMTRSTGSGFGQYVKNVVIDTDLKMTVRDEGWGDFTSDRLVNISPFLIEIPRDYITIDSSSYTTSPDDLNITKFVVEETGTISFVVDDVLQSAITLDFAITQNGTVIDFTDTETSATSRSLDAGETATLVYEGPDTYHWVYNSPESKMVMDVQIDGESCVAGTVAYISSMTEAEVLSCEALFE